VIELRWIVHLLGALIVGIILIIVWEQYSGVSISKMSEDFFARYGIGAGLMLAILIIVAIAIWVRSSRG
jgi:hypothetical protein